MKSKDKTKQKKHESTIGKIIYGFLLFMPLLAIGVTCAYAIFNKNAYKSFDYEQKSTITEINTTNVIKTNLQYMFVYEDNPSSTVSTTGVIYYSDISVDWSDYTSSVGNWNAFEITLNTNGNLYIYLYRENESSWGTYLTNRWQEIKSLIFTSSTDLATNRALPTKIVTGYQYTSVNVNQISSVFYYSIDKVQQSPLFNWAEDSAIYTGMTATCNALNITTTFIPLLMTYWLIISIIYFLYDMILIILHVFHRKIHELEESI